MTKNINLPILFFLILFISKEIFSYDSEKVVIFCILFFIILTYYNSREMLYNSFLLKSIKLKEEYINLIKSKENFEIELQSFWSNFIELENQLIKIYQWLKTNLKLAITKANKNRKLVLFHIIKDQLNILVKDQLKINQNLNIFLAKNTISNMKGILYAGLDFNLLYNNNLNYYFNKLANISISSNIIYLILNKIQNNKEFSTNNKNWTNFNTFLYFKYNL